MGVMGKEGRQAVNNSDFAIGQFRCGRGCNLPHVSCSATKEAHMLARRSAALCCAAL